jgi:3-deoxy-D-manno-octulosonic acid (KDO) 8-phosphate synthase
MKVSELNISVSKPVSISNFLFLAGVCPGIPVPAVADIISQEEAAVVIRYGGILHIPDFPGRQTCLLTASALSDRASSLRYDNPFNM